MTLGARAAAVLSLAAACASCEGDSAQQSPATTDATTSPATSSTTSTTGSPSPTTATAATTETTASASSVSTTTTTAGPSSSSGTGGTSDTNSSTTGVGGSAGDNGDSSTVTSDGSGGTSTAGTSTAGTSTGTTTGGTTAGVLVLEDDCSPEACGGALPNTTWRHTRACVQKDQIIGPIQSFCPSITLASSSGALAGTLSFTDDTYDQDVIFALSIALDVPADCDVNCASFGSTLAILGFPDATCTESDDVCHCVGSAQGTDPRSGDYATSDDGTLTFVFPYGGIETSYCVRDGSLRYLIPVMLVPQGSPMDVVYEAVPQ